MDELLQGIDEVFAARTARRTSGEQYRTVRVSRSIDSDQTHGVKYEAPAKAQQTIWDRFGWIEAFVAVQFLWGALIFMPGAQQYRGYIRAMPYVASLGMFALYAMHRLREPLPRSSGLMISALLLLVLNLLHPTSQMSAGLAQCVFQFSIAAPLFWAYKAVRSPAMVERLLVLIFVMNALSAGLGILQVYFPERFMPSEFSSLGLQLNQVLSRRAHVRGQRWPRDRPAAGADRSARFRGNCGSVDGHPRSGPAASPQATSAGAGHPRCGDSRLRRDLPVAGPLDAARHHRRLRASVARRLSARALRQRRMGAPGRGPDRDWLVRLGSLGRRHIGERPLRRISRAPARSTRTAATAARSSRRPQANSSTSTRLAPGWAGGE